MATRTLEIDLRQGTGASSEPMYGVVTVQRTKAKSAGGFEILPFETTLKLINGKATITEAETDGTGPYYDSAYLFRVQNGYCAPRWGFMAALPDGSTPITTGELPMVDPITGEGIYMDAQEWNELYGDLPNRVTSLENSQSVQDQRLDDLEVLGGISPGDVSDATVTSLIINPESATSAALSTTIGEQLNTPESPAQTAGDARWVTQTGADIVVASEIERTGSETQVSGDARWVTNEGADNTVAEALGKQQSQSATAMLGVIASEAGNAEGLIAKVEKSRALEGIALGDRDLDDVVEPGRYHQNFVGYATAANHYPEYKSNTTLTVRNMAGSTLVQQRAFAILTNRSFTRYRKTDLTWTLWAEQASPKVTKSFFSEEQREYPITLTNTSIVDQIAGVPLPVLVRTGNTVELSGQLRVIPAGGGSTVTTIGTVPPDAFPFNGRYRWYPQMSTGGKMYSILVSPTGTVQMYNLTGAEANTTINLSATWAVKPPSKYAFERVCSRMREGTDYARTLTDTGSWLSIIAIHGGEAETGSSEISRAIRDHFDASWYEWDFLKPTVQGTTAFAVAHEVNSTFGDYKGSLFDDPGLMEMVIASDDCVAIHQAADGNGTNRPAGRLTCCGGENKVLRELIASKLNAAGFPALDNPDDFPGLQGTGPKQPHNFAKNMGVQMELSVSQYREFFTGGDLTRANRANKTPAFTAYYSAVVAAITEYRSA